jgi:hypothetical protein
MKNDNPQASKKNPMIQPDRAIKGSSYGLIVKYSDNSIKRATPILINEKIW